MRWAMSAREPATSPVAAAEIASGDRKSTRLNSSHTVISYAVFCLKKKKSTYPSNRVRTQGRATVKIELVQVGPGSARQRRVSVNTLYDHGAPTYALTARCNAWTNT